MSIDKITSDEFSAPRYGKHNNKDTITGQTLPLISSGGNLGLDDLGSMRNKYGRNKFFFVLQNPLRPLTKKHLLLGFGKYCYSEVF